MNAIASCDWSTPGADRYTGTVAAAIAAYGLPIATQSALIRAWERREFTDTVVIDREAIRGKTGNYGNLRAMHFGSAGRICQTVTRAGWSDSHIETGLVLCADSACIVVPSACSNVARITRRPDALAGPSGVGDTGAPQVVADDVPIAIADPFAQAPEAVTPVGPASFYGSPGWPYAPSYVVGGYITHPEPVSSVPEPESWALLLAGLGAIWFVARRRAHA
jgi:hypothetical protein